jgi:hypothetical protein
MEKKSTVWIARIAVSAVGRHPEEILRASGWVSTPLQAGCRARLDPVIGSMLYARRAYRKGHLARPAQIVIAAFAWAWELWPSSWLSSPSG